MIPIIGFFVSESLKEKEIILSPSNLHENKSSIPAHYWGNQEQYSDLEPKVRKEVELPCDRILHIDDNTERKKIKMLSKK